MKKYAAGYFGWTSETISPLFSLRLSILDFHKDFTYGFIQLLSLTVSVSQGC